MTKTSRILLGVTLIVADPVCVWIVARLHMVPAAVAWGVGMLLLIPGIRLFTGAIEVPPRTHRP